MANGVLIELKGKQYLYDPLAEVLSPIENLERSVDIDDYMVDQRLLESLGYDGVFHEYKNAKAI